MRPSNGLILAALASTTFANMPLFLLGGLAVLIRPELQFGETLLGLCASIFFLAAGVSSIPGAFLSQRLGPMNAIRASAAVTALALAGSCAAQDWTHVAVLMGVSGFAMGVAAVATNHMLAVGIPPARRGLAFGTKMAAVPLAALLAGLILPTIGLTLGWRLAYLTSSGLLLVVLVSVRRGFFSPPPSEAGTSRIGDFKVPLLLLAAGGMMAGIGTASVGQFLVEYLTWTGITAQGAGIVLAAGGVVALATRVFAGWIADRRGRGSLGIAAALLLLGGAGFVLLAVGQRPAILVFASLAVFAGSWGWAGLLWLAIARSVQTRVGYAMAVVQIGLEVGGVLGPTAFGALVENSGYGTAWLTVSVSSAMAALLFAAARQVLLTGKRRRSAGR